MEELNDELWKLGILAKTEHNEVAPAQHELAPIYTTTNIATDHNQLTMEIMQKVAAKHGLVCLLHEKPFAGVNGSGKHNNWSIATDAGQNLLSPGETPYENAQFLLFLCAVIKAVDDYQDLLRISVATAGNDHRLGANEAPPAVVSIFLGDELNAVLEAIENDTPYSGAEKTQMKLGVDVLPKFNRDTTDRNRTSPFAFTGNKFEFRMLGSSNSIACANIMLNSAVAESLKSYADRLEGAADFETALHDLIKKTIKDHKRIIFNGNGYDDAWIAEATEKRGLCNYRTTPDCMPHLLDEKNVKMLTSQKVYTEIELKSRCEIMLEKRDAAFFPEGFQFLVHRKGIFLDRLDLLGCCKLEGKCVIFIQQRVSKFIIFIRKFNRGRIECDSLLHAVSLRERACGNIADNDLKGDDGNLFDKSLPLAELFHKVCGDPRVFQSPHQ